MSWRGGRHLIEYLIFRSVVCIVQSLSPRRCAQAATWLATLIHCGLPRRWTRYEVARANLRVAFGDRYDDRQIDALIYGMWVHLFRLVGEIIHLPRKMRLDRVVEAIEFRGKTSVVRALCSGRPVLLLSGHFGNWEMAISIFGLFGFRMGLVAREMDNPWLNHWFLKFRKYTGHRPIPKRGGYDLITRILSLRGNLALLADQDAGSGGVFVNFFGKSASTHKSIALLALQYDALICVGYARRLSGPPLPGGWPRYELGCEEVIDPREFAASDAVRAITERYTLALERAIRRAPEQYFWVHRRWKSVPKVKTQRRSPVQRQAG